MRGSDARSKLLPDLCGAARQIGRPWLDFDCCREAWRARAGSYGLADELPRFDAGRRAILDEPLRGVRGQPRLSMDGGPLSADCEKCDGKGFLRAIRI